jgi:hypothetical protein
MGLLVAWPASQQQIWLVVGVAAVGADGLRSAMVRGQTDCRPYQNRGWLFLSTLLMHQKSILRVRSVLPMKISFIPSFLLLGIVPAAVSAVFNALPQNGG